LKTTSHAGREIRVHEENPKIFEKKKLELLQKFFSKCFLVRISKQEQQRSAATGISIPKFFGL